MKPGLDGVVAARTAISWVDPVRGAFVRGYPLVGLASLTFEEVAHVVTVGELGAAPIDRGLAADRVAIARALGAALGPERALVAAMPLIDDWAQMPAVVAAVHGTGCAGATYAERALRALGATREDAAAVRSFEVLLSLEAEHGLSASTFACRVAASSGADLGVAFAAAAAALSGPLHGGATASAMGLLREVAASSAAEVVAAHRREKRRLSGFGHRIYKGPDPRVPVLRAAMGRAPLQPAAAALEAAVAQAYGLHPNVDFWSAVLLDALGVDPHRAVAAFALGVAPGWAAHYAEQAREGRLIRPDSEYVGPAERPVPMTTP